jgi:hypothetical protein
MPLSLALNISSSLNPKAKLIEIHQMQALLSAEAYRHQY